MNKITQKILTFFDQFDINISVRYIVCLGGGDMTLNLNQINHQGGAQTHKRC